MLTNRFASLVSLLALSGTLAFAQQTTPPPPQGSDAPSAPAQRGSGGPGMGRAMQPRGGRDGGPEGMPHGGMHGGMRGEGFILPPGMWWKNPELVTRVGLTSDQVKKMDDIFLQARIKLVHIKASLEEEELLLEPMINANPPDSGKALAQIGRIADTRADLEKANAAMLLSIRGVLTADQWTKLHTGEHGPRHPGMGQ